MTKILINHKKQAELTPAIRVKRIRKVMGWVLGVFIVMLLFAAMRGISEKFVPGWAFYTWG